MYYQIYRDRDILAGAAWYDPDDGDYIQVQEMPHAPEDGEVTLVEKGNLYVTDKRLEESLRSSGLFEEQGPPNPPKGRKHWFSRPWTPPPQPGNLFWMPPPIQGFIVMTAWKEWARVADEGGEFSQLPAQVQKSVLLGAREVAAYHGIEMSHNAVVIQSTETAEAQKKRDWPNADRVEISNKPEKAVFKILRNMGIPNAELES